MPSREGRMRSASSRACDSRTAMAIVAARPSASAEITPTIPATAAGCRRASLIDRSSARRTCQYRLAVCEPAEVIGQQLCARITPRRILLQAFEADRLEISRHARAEPARRNGILARHDGESRFDRAGDERRATGQQLVEDRSQRIDVGPYAKRLPLARDLLRGHVAGSAHDQSMLSQAHVIETFGQPEVRDLGSPARG